VNNRRDVNRGPAAPYRRHPSPNDVQQEPDRSTLIGILLISLILGVWMLFLAPRYQPTPQVQEPPPSADEPAVIETPDDEGALLAPTDSSFAAALRGEDRDVVVATDRYRAVFSTHGGTLESMRLLDYRKAESDEPVELVSNEAGALAVLFNPPQGRIVDTRTLYFRPAVDGAPFRGDTLRVPEDAEEPVELAFEAPVGQGALRLVYGFRSDSYEVTFRIETPGTNVLAQSGGYEVVWDGALPLAEHNPTEEVAQAGAFIHWGGDTDVLRLTEAGEARPVAASGAVDWAAVKTKFFAAVLIPDSETEGATIEGSQIGAPDAPDSFVQDYTARLEMPRPEPNEAASFRLYLGPMELRRLDDYDLGLYEMVDFGAYLGWMIRPIVQYVVAPTFALLGAVLPNYGLVIILFALLVKIVLWPLSRASFRNMARMRELQPQMEAVKEKYADDPQKQQEELMRVYKEAGVNPLGGCLPMLLQYPILIALWRFFQSTLVLRQEQFLWAQDLSAPDPILHLPFAIPLYGDFVAGFTLLMGVSMIVQMKLSTPSGTAATGQMKVMMYVLPAVFFLFFNRFPSGLSLYYLFFNVFSIIQQRFITPTTPPAGAAKGKPEKTRPARTNGRAPSNGQTKEPKKPARR
jgi:YidC/Oxa1 family membrane protein insertase